MNTIEKNISVIPLWVPILLGNLIPLYGALFLSWDIFTIFFLFWIENVIIGFYTVMRMAAVGGAIAIGAPRVIKIGAVLGSLFFAGFFTVHYGMFCMGHFTFLVSIFYEGENSSFGFGVQETIEFVKEFMVGGIYWGVLAIFIAEGVKAVMAYNKPNVFEEHLDNKMIPKEALEKLKEQSPNIDLDVIGKASRLPKLMFEPYGRIVVLHIAIVFGGILVQFLGEPILGLALLIALKIAYDFGVIDPMKRVKEKMLRKNKSIS